MNIYTIALFLHIAGALGLFAALGLEWTGLWQMGSALSPEPVRAWLGILKSTRKVMLGSMLAVLLSGIYMTVAVWGSPAWILVTLGALVLVMALSMALSGPRMAAVGRALAAGKGTLSQAFHSASKNPLLWVSIQTRVAIALGIVFLKIAKPDLLGSLLTIGVAVLLGLVSSLPMLRREPAPESPSGARL